LTSDIEACRRLRFGSTSTFSCRRPGDPDYSDEHKHCTMQPLYTAFGGAGGPDFWMGGRGRGRGPFQSPSL